MSHGHFELLAAGIAQIRPDVGERPIDERVRRARKTVEEHLRDGDVTRPESQELRYLIARVARLNGDGGLVH